jgi:t-SNARE complex subunit (syntaxin)
MPEKDPTHSPTPKGENLSDYAQGRGDVAEMREALEDIGYEVDGRSNPFSPDGPALNFKSKNANQDDAIRENNEGHTVDQDSFFEMNAEEKKRLSRQAEDYTKETAAMTELVKKATVDDFAKIEAFDRASANQSTFTRSNQSKIDPDIFSSYIETRRLFCKELEELTARWVWTNWKRNQGTSE